MSQVSEEREADGEIDDGVDDDSVTELASESNCENSQDVEIRRREKTPIENRMKSPQGSFNVRPFGKDGRVQENRKCAEVTFMPNQRLILDQLRQKEAKTPNGGILVLGDESNKMRMMFSLILSTREKSDSNFNGRELKLTEGGTLICSINHKQWRLVIQTFSQYTKQEQLTFGWFYGRHPKIDHLKRMEWAKKDVVITPYSACSTDIKLGSKSIFRNIPWKRIILDTVDGAHIKQGRELETILSLHASYRWVLTDKPIEYSQCSIQNLVKTFFERPAINNQGMWPRPFYNNNATSREQWNLRELTSLQVIPSRDNREESYKNSKNNQNAGTPRKRMRGSDPRPSASDTATARPYSRVPTVLPNTESGSRVHRYNKLDIRNFIDEGAYMPVDMKNHLLKNAWVPPKDYDFAADAPLFPPSDGMISGTAEQSFFTVPFSHRYNDSQYGYRAHAETSGHQAAEKLAKSAVPEGTHHRRQPLLQKPTDQSNQALSAVVSCLIFCGTHDLPLQQDNLDESALMHSYQLRMEAGDSYLKRDLERGLNNLLYRSPIAHKEIIDLCSDVIREQILMRVKEAPAYSILADETAKIAGKDHLAIGLRFFDEQANEVVEVFLGFAELEGCDAPGIAEAIHEFVTIKLNLDPDRCVGLGFDGCSATFGKEEHVLAFLSQNYGKALYFHCSWRKLHLIANELTDVPSIRSRIGALAEINALLRRSVSKPGDINDVPEFHESKWWTNVEDYVVAMVDQLPRLYEEGDLTTKTRAYELRYATQAISFVVSMVLIAQHTALLERVANILQSKPLDIVNTNNHIQTIVGKLRSDLEDVENVATAVLQEADLIAERLELKSSGTCDADQQRSRVDSTKRLTIPYLKSIISFLEVRFSAGHSPAFSLTYLHPNNMKGVSFAEWNERISPCETFYDLQIELTEKQLWFEKWKNVKEVPNIIEFLNKNGSFYPTIRDALLIMLSQPYASTVERSFSTLRRIETWRRNTVDANRSSSLAMLSMHREWVIRNKEQLVEDVVEKFATYHHADMYSEN